MKNNTIIYFSAEWCQPCVGYAPTIEKARTSGIPIRKVDVDQDPMLASKYQIRTIPTLVKVDSNGKVLGTLLGVQNLNSIKKFYK